MIRGSVGHSLCHVLEVALSATSEHSDGVERLYFPAFDDPATNGGGAEDLDAEDTRQVYGRFTCRGLAVTVRTVRQDLGAVEGAVTGSWRNGPVEGPVNRLKTRRRQIEGRAGVDLLRARLLPLPKLATP